MSIIIIYIFLFFFLKVTGHSKMTTSTQKFALGSDVVGIFRAQTDKAKRGREDTAASTSTSTQKFALGSAMAVITTKKPNLLDKFAE